MLSVGSVVIIKDVAALGAELGRIGRIRRSPAALVALIYLSACGLGCTAVLAEFALIYCTARAGPAVDFCGSGLGCAAVLAEFTCI